MAISEFREVIADAVWILASETPGMTREALPDAMEDNLRLVDFVDLLRHLWRANGGFPGCMAERFPASNDGPETAAGEGEDA